MPTNHDDADDLLRGAMKTLDGEVPSGYFEALPNRTLARLEGNGMQMQSSGIDNADDTNPVMTQDLGHDAVGSGSDRAPTALERDGRDDDSGLHDIRSLASSTKARLSKRFTAPVVDEDVLASSSAGWKAVALPEPAKMVSLPEVSDLAPMEEVKAAVAASESRRSKRESKRGPAVAAAAPVLNEVAALRDVVATPAVSFGSGMLAQKPSKKKGGLIAMVAVAAAAAAALAFYVVTADQAGTAVESKSAAPAIAAQPEATAQQVAQPAPVAAAAAPTTPPTDEAATATGAAAADVVAAAPAESDDDGKRAAKPASKSAAKRDKVEIDLSIKGKEPAPPKAEPTKKPDGAGKGAGGSPSGAGKEEQQSLDDLLAEAGVNKDKKPDAPKLEKKSLSSDDIRKGMQSVASKAQGCYAGTQGTASVKLTVAPTGKVQKVTVSGVFAGTPVGTCVSSAVQGIQFPAWDGGPQSISYSYLLAE